MHLSKFAKGLQPGQQVRQKQVIGYVGMTGLATGPHLHFCVRMNGAFIDPLKLKPAREAPLAEQVSSGVRRRRRDRACRRSPRFRSAAARSAGRAGLSPMP